MFRMAGITARNPSGRCHPDAKHRAAEGSVAFLSPKPRTGHNFRIAGHPPGMARDHQANQAHSMNSWSFHGPATIDICGPTLDELEPFGVPLIGHA
jgi:hypothetical protein